MPETKKFLDYNGLVYLASKLNEYPNNTVLSAVINAIEQQMQEDKTELENDIAALTINDLGQKNNQFLYIYGGSASDLINSQGANS